MALTIAGRLVGRKNNFDFIRFIAALAVVFSHSFDLSINKYQEPLRQLKGDILSIGSIAVAVFFIISGFLINKSIIKSPDLLTYFYSRVLRIYPALIAITLISVFIVGPLLTSCTIREYFTSPQTIKYLINTTCLKIYTDLPGVFDLNYNTTYNGSLWTLAHELICYIILASVISFRKRKLKIAITLFVTIIAINLISRSNVLILNYFYHHCYYFMLGCLLFTYRNEVPLKRTYFLVAAAVFLLNIIFNTDYTSLILINGISLAYLVIFVGLTPLLNLSYFTRYGDFSYGIYISAFPIQQYLYSRFIDLSCYSNFVISSLLALCIAIVCWHFVEKPFLQLKKAPLSLIKRTRIFIL